MKSLKAILSGVIVLGAFHAQAEYLLWSLDWDADEVSSSAKYAAIVVLDSNGESLTNPDTLLTWVDPDTGATGTRIKKNADADPVEVAADISSYSDPDDGYKFALRVYDSDKNEIKTYNAATYADLASAGVIWGADSMNPGVSTSWNPATYAVPEPATGTLFILGSLMLFRRKRA